MAKIILSYYIHLFLWYALARSGLRHMNPDNVLDCGLPFEDCVPRILQNLWAKKSQSVDVVTYINTMSKWYESTG